MNDDLLTGRVKVRMGSPLQEELIGLMRDPDYDPRHPDYKDKPPTEDPSCPNHCTDAGLYSYREAWHFMPRTVAPKQATVYEADEYEEQALRDFKKRSDTSWFDRVEDISDTW